MKLPLKPSSLFFSLCCSAMTLLPLPSQAQVTIRSLLAELTDYSATARWPAPFYTCKEASSYDRLKVAPDKPGWFANSDQNQFVRTEMNAGRSEKVMLDVDGPGSIVRFWLTTDRNKKGVIRIYLDGGAQPTISFPAYDLLTGDLKVGSPLAQAHPGYRPDGNGGNTLFLPIPYARHCKVTWEEMGQSSRYYQINYRSYDADAVVKTFTRKDFDAAKPEIDRVNHALNAPEIPLQKFRTVSYLGELAAGKEQSVALPAGPAAVRQIELKTPAAGLLNPERALRSLVVKIDCDGEPTVWCPAGDLFGSGVGINTVKNWYTEVNTAGDMVCRWVMPYRSTARISLQNLASSPIKVALTATTAAWKWDERSMHFHASWHYESGLKTEPPREWNYNTISGRGVYVGDVLALYNPIATWYGEGDEKIWVDEESFPSHLGTGTEDYYGFSYAPQPVFQSPFCGQPRIDQVMTQGHNTLIRTRSLDAIPFRRSLKFDFELISWKPMSVTYAATTFWYALPGAVTSVHPQPTDAALPIPTLAEAQAAAAPPRKPGAIECETMNVIAKSEGISVGEQDMEPFGPGKWSNGKHLLVKAEKPGDFVEIEWPAGDSAPRRLKLYATQAPDFGTLGFEVNGDKSAAQLDNYGEIIQPGPACDLGVFTPRNGKFTLRARVVGANAAAKGAKYFFGLDCVVMERP